MKHPRASQHKETHIYNMHMDKCRNREVGLIMGRNTSATNYPGRSELSAWV